METAHLVVISYHAIEFDNVGVFELRHDGCLLEQLCPTFLSLSSGEGLQSHFH